MTTSVLHEGVGPLLRSWRQRRRLSQLAVSANTGVSTRHLSCVETGRSAPSREMVQHLAAFLEVPLRERNRLLLAAGFAPAYPHLDTGEAHTPPVAEVLAMVLAGSGTNPTVIVDRHWNLVQANEAAFWLCSGVDPTLLEPPANVARVSLHPDGLAPHILNLDEYAEHLLARLRRTADLSGDAELEDLIAELDAIRPEALRNSQHGGPAFALPLAIDVDGHRLSLFSTIATFGTATEVTLSEMSIETFYPSDEPTASVLRSVPWHG